MDSLKCTENESFLKGQLANIIVKVLLQQNDANNFFLVSFLLIVLLQLSQLFTHCSPQHCPLPHSHSKSPPSCPGPWVLYTCSLMLIIFNILEFYFLSLLSWHSVNQEHVLIGMFMLIQHNDKPGSKWYQVIQLSLIHI